MILQDNLPTEEDTSTVHDNETHSDTDNDDSIPRIIYDNSESDPGGEKKRKTFHF